MTEEEQQISLPRWTNYLKSAFLLLLTVALLILPFLPFLLFNARHRKALRMREAFASANAAEAVCAIFRQTVKWLDAMGLGAGNALFSTWADELSFESFPEGYTERFRRCAALFEEAAYSDHLIGGEERLQVLRLLEETEETMVARADWKKRLSLRYRECLWV